MGNAAYLAGGSALQVAANHEARACCLGSQNNGTTRRRRRRPVGCRWIRGARPPRATPATPRGVQNLLSPARPRMFHSPSGRPRTRVKQAGRSIYQRRPPLSRAAGDGRRHSIHFPPFPALGCWLGSCSSEVEHCAFSAIAWGSLGVLDVGHSVAWWVTAAVARWTRCCRGR